MKAVRLAPTVTAVLLALIFAVPARAGIFNVTTTADTTGTCTAGNCSLRDAITAANASADDDTINVPGAVAHYTVGSPLPAFTTSNVTIQGAGAIATIIDSGGAQRLFSEGATGKALAVNGVTLTGATRTASGDAVGGAAISFQGSDLSLSGDAFTSDTATLTGGHFSGGGAVFFSSGGTLTVSDCSFVGDQLTITGGLGNEGGGALFASSGSVVHLSGSTFADNTASVAGSSSTNGGGAVHAEAGLDISGSTFTDNSLTVPPAGVGTSGGGALFLNTGTPSSISSTNFTGSKATLTMSGNANGGGAVHNEGPALTLTDVSITGSVLTLNNPQSQSGGGGFFGNTGSQLTMTRVNISGNSYTQDSGGGTNLGGGGIHSEGPPFTLTDSTVDGNAVDVNTTTGDGGGGGGILVNTGSQQTISGSSISGNSSNMFTGNRSGGGGLHDNGAPVTITNSTVSGNSSLPKSGNGAVRGGGGMLFFTGSAVALTSDTVASNSTEGEGGGILISGATVTVRDSIFSGGTRINGATTTGDNCTPDSGSLTSTGNNLESLNTCGFAAAGDLKNTDPLLGTLGSHGGSPSQMLLAGSPALNAGAICPATDQRGVPRPQGAACDIGAVEDQPAAVATGSSKVTATTATLLGTFNPLFTAGSYHFDFGRTSAYGTSTPAVAAGDDGAGLGASAALTKLTPHTSYHYRLVGSNALGGAVGADATFTTPFPDPSVSKFAVVPKRFRRGPGRTAKIARAIPRGGVFRFTLNEKARVQIKIYRKLPGRRSKGHCRAPSKRLAHAKRCTRLKLAGTLTRRSLRKGRNRVKFSGRIGRKALAPGAYQANVVAIVKGALKTKSRARKAGFKILAG